MSSDWNEVTAQWRREMAFVGSNESGGSVQMGTLEGKPGVSSMEMLLLGLAGCTGVDIVHILRKMRQPLEDLQVKIRAKQADEHPKVYTQLEVTYVLWGDDLGKKAVEQAIQLSEEKYCSASVMLGKTAQITSSYHILSPGEDYK
jgi:putative redox protein